MRVVVDTNILVSALWSPNGAPAQIISSIIGGALIPGYEKNVYCNLQNISKKARRIRLAFVIYFPKNQPYYI